MLLSLILTLNLQLVPTEKIGKDLAIDLAIFSSGAAFTQWTTAHAFELRTGKELNPFGQGTEKRNALKILEVGGKFSLNLWLRTSGRKRTADILRYLSLIVSLIDGGRNLYLTYR